MGDITLNPAASEVNTVGTWRDVTQHRFFLFLTDLSFTFIRFLILTRQWSHTVVIKRICFTQSCHLLRAGNCVVFVEQRALLWNRLYHQKLNVGLPVRDGGTVRAQQVHQFSHEICFTKVGTQRPSPPPLSLKQSNSLKERSATGTPRSFPVLHQREKDVFKTPLWEMGQTPRTAAQEHKSHTQGRSVLLQMVLRVISTNTPPQSPQPPHHPALLKRHHRSRKRSGFPLPLYPSCQKKTQS